MNSKLRVFAIRAAKIAVVLTAIMLGSLMHMSGVHAASLEQPMAQAVVDSAHDQVIVWIANPNDAAIVADIQIKDWGGGYESTLPFFTTQIPRNYSRECGGSMCSHYFALPLASQQTVTITIPLRPFGSDTFNVSASASLDSTYTAQGP